MSELTQTETDRLWFLTQYRSAAAVTEEEWQYLLRLANRLPKPLPTKTCGEVLREAMYASSPSFNHEELADLVIDHHEKYGRSV